MKSEIDKYVINKIKQRRIEMGVSQKGMADILGVTPGFIGQIELERTNSRYSVHDIYLISRELECEPSDFFPPLDSLEFQTDLMRKEKRSLKK